MDPKQNLIEQAAAVLKEGESVTYPHVKSQRIAQRIHVERAIVRAFVEAVLKAHEGYTLRVHDGEEFATEKTRDTDEIMKAIMSTDEDHLYVYEGSRRVGYLYLVYGNSGWDVMSDYTDIPEFKSFVLPADNLADAFDELMHRPDRACDSYCARRIHAMSECNCSRSL
jgi:adenylosuccinate synthase